MRISIGNLSAWFVIVGGVCNFMFIPWLIYKYITDDSTYDYLLIFSILIGVLFIFIHNILAFFVKCPTCSKLLTVRGLKKIKPNTHDSGLEVALLWFSNNVHCMHCGVKLDKSAYNQNLKRDS